jgi:hypothetical protein
MCYCFQFESNQILSHYGWYKSLIIYLTLLFDVSRVGEGGAGWMVEQNSGWLGNLGWMELMVTFSPVNGEHDVNRLGTSRLEVDRVVGVVGDFSTGER